MIQANREQAASIRSAVSRVVSNTKALDIHTHLYSPGFGEILLWGIDELLTYHYLVSEAFRWLDIPYAKYWDMLKREQADLVWKTLFIDHSPVSESSRGVITILDMLGLDTSSRDLESYRKFFAEKKTEDYVNKVFELANVESVIMTNDPFDDLERPSWLEKRPADPRFAAALRIDTMLNNWDSSVKLLREWGYEVDTTFGGETSLEIRRFLKDWIAKTNAVYMAASLPPTFDYPDDSLRGKVIQKCVLPVAAETGLPFAMMIGVKRLTNPGLGIAGDSVGRCNINALERICSSHPDIKFIVTMLSRENQHELCVAARKFRNLHVFGCWWFMNIPNLVDEVTRMRMDLIGLSMTPQHSDARVLDQLIYHWCHYREVITEVLTDRYTDLACKGWQVTEQEIQRDVTALSGGAFRQFIGKH